MPRVVLIGTGTNVGKTFVAEALARTLARRGVPVQALKPVETGVTGLTSNPAAGPPAGTDAARLESASFHVKHARPHPLLALEPPISPHLAARAAGVSVTAAGIAAWCDMTLRHNTSEAWQLIETAGGVFSPLSDTDDNYTLAELLRPAIWLLVAPDALGVLHDTRATLGAMAARGRLPDYLVLSTSRADASTGTNAAELARLGVRPAPECVVGRDRPGDIEPLTTRLLAHS